MCAPISQRLIERDVLPLSYGAVQQRHGQLRAVRRAQRKTVAVAVVIATIRFTAAALSS
jgi:hypothetical protein